MTATAQASTLTGELAHAALTLALACSAVIPLFYSARMGAWPPETYDDAFTQDLHKALVRDQDFTATKSLHASDLPERQAGSSYHVGS